MHPVLSATAVVVPQRARIMAALVHFTEPRFAEAHKPVSSPGGFTHEAYERCRDSSADAVVSDSRVGSVASVSSSSQHEGMSSIHEEDTMTEDAHDSSHDGTAAARTSMGFVSATQLDPIELWQHSHTLLSTPVCCATLNISDPIDWELSSDDLTRRCTVVSPVVCSGWAEAVVVWVEYDTTVPSKDPTAVDSVGVASVCVAEVGVAEGDVTLSDVVHPGRDAALASIATCHAKSSQARQSAASTFAGPSSRANSGFSDYSSVRRRPEPGGQSVWWLWPRIEVKSREDVSGQGERCARDFVVSSVVDLSSGSIHFSFNVGGGRE